MSQIFFCIIEGDILISAVAVNQNCPAMSFFLGRKFCRAKFEPFGRFYFPKFAGKIRRHRISQRGIRNISRGFRRRTVGSAFQGKSHKIIAHKKSCAEKKYCHNRGKYKKFFHAVTSANVKDYNFFWRTCKR